MIIHELSHYLMARIFNEKIIFRFKFGYLFNKIPIPRYVWYMPANLTNFQKKLVALAGFSGEILFGILFTILKFDIGVIYLILSIIHLIVYKFYAGNDSDFNWL